MDLEVKQTIVTIVSVTVIFIVVWASLIIECYLFGELLAEYLNYMGAFISYMIYTLIVFKLACGAGQLVVDKANEYELRQLKAAAEAEELDKPDEQNKQD